MERTERASVMQWFKKLLQKKDENQSKSSAMKWFKRSTAGREVEQEEAPLRNEIDVVPRTEIFSASRQALENINIVLKAGESSGEPSKKYQDKIDNNKTGCSNKYCCGIPADDDDDSIHAEPATKKGDDESIRNHKNSKTTFIENLRAADNNTHASKGSSVNANATKCRRPSKVIKHVKNSVHFQPCVDYGRLECPDSFYPSVPDYCGKYVELKSKRQRHYCESCDLFTTSDKPKSAENDKSPLNYRLLSNVEKRLDESEYNLRNCKIYNEVWRQIQRQLRYNVNNQWILEDFNDDNLSTRMSEDTRAIKEFYRLSIENHLLVHFHNIKVETGLAYESQPRKFLNFLAWIALKGKEITEEHKISETSWITTVLNFFIKKSK